MTERAAPLAYALGSLLLACGVLGCALPPARPPGAVRVLELVSAEVAARRGPATMSKLIDDGATASLVCVGEQHDEPLHHRLEAGRVEVWSERAAARGDELALGLEMFEVALQPSLDAFSRGDLDWPSLVEVSDWQHRWGYDPAIYRPLFEVARARHVPMLALNAARELTRRVARAGLDGLAPEVRAGLPELDLGDEEHRRFFAAVMGLEPGMREEGEHGGAPENMYAAQVIWDETMASRAAEWLQGERRRLMIVAGNGHCHDSAIMRRALRRLHGQRRGLTILTRSRGGELPPLAASDYVVTVGEERMAKRKKNDAPPIEQYGDGIIAKNRRAGFDYELGDTFEAGIALIGSEVKMLRQGKADLSEAFVRVDRGEAILHGANIPELAGTAFGHLAKRPRKLLLHRREIEELARATEREGMTIVATLLYFRSGRAKIEIALARGKKKYDKRETLKRKDADREARAAVAEKRRR